TSRWRRAVLPWWPSPTSRQTGGKALPARWRAHHSSWVRLEKGESVMRIGVLGTGMVGNAIASKLVSGHRIMLGSRTAASDASQPWLRSVGGQAQIGAFSDAAAFGELVFDCTSGAHALAALRQAGAANLRGKILIQVGNPLDTTKGFPPSLTV